LVPLEYGTYIRVYGATKSPHLLPKFILDRLVLQEIAYQTLVYGVGAALNRDKKMIWPPLPLWVGPIPSRMLRRLKKKLTPYPLSTLTRKYFQA
jgi:hypothetical protein